MSLSSSRDHWKKDKIEQLLKNKPLVKIDPFEHINDDELIDVIDVFEGKTQVDR